MAVVKDGREAYTKFKVLERFEKLPFKNKICFIESVREGKEFIYIPELKRLNVLGGDEMPYVKRTRNPVPSGAAVIVECERPDETALEISKLLQALFGLSAHKISVMGMK